MTDLADRGAYVNTADMKMYLSEANKMSDGYANYYKNYVSKARKNQDLESVYGSGLVQRPDDPVATTAVKVNQMIRKDGYQPNQLFTGISKGIEDILNLPANLYNGLAFLTNTDTHMQTFHTVSDEVGATPGLINAWNPTAAGWYNTGVNAYSQLPWFALGAARSSKMSRQDWRRRTEPIWPPAAGARIFSRNCPLLPDYTTTAPAAQIEN